MSSVCVLNDLRFAFVEVSRPSGPCALRRLEINLNALVSRFFEGFCGMIFRYT